MKQRPPETHEILAAVLTVNQVGGGNAALELLLTESEAAKIINFSVRTLQAWRCRGVGPPVLRISGGRSIRYRYSDLLEWVESGVVGR